MDKLKLDIIITLKDIIKNCFTELGDLETVSIYLETPRDKQFGDLSTNIAMQIAKRLNKNPKEIADVILGGLKKSIGSSSLREYIADVKVEGAGFINFYLRKTLLYESINEILKKGKDFGRDNIGENKKLQIEFVSANPTGPLSIAHARQAAVGDTLANVLSFLGWKVTREYYINDEGNQINLLGESVKARYLELLKKDFCFPENGYKGKYIYTIAQTLIDRFGDSLLNKNTEFFSNFGVKLILKWIKEDLKKFGIRFDSWFSQKHLSKSNKIKEALKVLRKNGFIYEKDGAVWFKSTAFGDDKDRVIIKSDSSFTYIAPDIAYHRDKFRRDFARLINIWGPDHHGYIPRLKAAVSALGFNEKDIAILIVQLVTLYKDKTPVPMSTREGQFITLRELIAEVGRDAARYFFLMRKIDSHLDFDMELAKKQSPENPVFYIQYAHARISSILKKTRLKSSSLINSDLNLLSQPEELELIKLITRFPDIVKQSGISLEPYRLIPYLETLSKTFHNFYDKHRVIGADRELSKARLALIETARIVIKNGLNLMGVSAPMEM
ncbi:MAG: arginine--tRNA ligase [Candidatus Omnitrophica bacterium]|nr:arginine--tRNA ligase [Candidatus Omnitrophota bacterium]